MALLFPQFHRYKNFPKRSDKALFTYHHGTNSLSSLKYNSLGSLKYKSGPSCSILEKQGTCFYTLFTVAVSNSRGNINPVTEENQVLYKLSLYPTTDENSPDVNGKSSFNPYLRNGFSHHYDKYQLGEFTFIFRGVRSVLIFISFIDKIPPSKQNSPRWDAAFCGVTSGAILFAYVP